MVSLFRPLEAELSPERNIDDPPSHQALVPAVWLDRAPDPFDAACILTHDDADTEQSPNGFIVMSNVPRPEAVLFDIGNVLITWQPEMHYDAWIGAERRKAMFATVDLHGMNERFDRGETFKSVVEETAAAYPEFEAEILMWHDRWLDLAQPVIDHSVRLLHALRAKGVPVFALSNFGIDSFALSESRDTFLKDFDRRYISGHMGVTKPDPRIYQMVEEDCGIAPERLLFADDKPDNIAAAATRGWQTHLFENPEGWAARLVEAGLLTETEAA